MKLLAIVLFTIVASPTFAKSKSLLLAGTVTLHAEIQVQDSKEGRPQIVSKSSPELKVEVQKRLPASVVRVSAP